MSRVLGRPVDARNVALATAGVLALGTGVLTYNYLASASHPQRAAQRSVVVAVRTIPAHAVIAQDMLALVQRPADAVDPDALAAPAAAAGSTAVNEIPAGSAITASKLQRYGALGFPARVPKGKRAVSIAIDRVKGVSDLIRPGDHVDVIAVVAAQGDAAPHAVTFIRDAKVLATGQSIDPNPAASPSPDGSASAGYQTATLEVTPKQADLLALGDVSATLRLSLRPLHESPRSEPVEPLHLATAAATHEAPPVAPPAAAPAPAAAPPHPTMPLPPRAAAPHNPPAPAVTVIDGDAVVGTNASR
ncbi:MAG: Flp pilus assembly protein CpaB [Candidatus Eremiobacteraeota bacterium]|nr:Flp pilus assembly protein CpaB [Candidatus Eremiobacteraeota bacterium]